MSMRLTCAWGLLMALLAGEPAHARGMGSDIVVVRAGKTVRTLDSGMRAWAVDVPTRRLYRLERGERVQHLVARDFEGKTRWRVLVDIPRTSSARRLRIVGAEIVVVDTGSLLLGFDVKQGALRYRIERSQANLRHDGQHVYAWGHYGGGHVTKWDLATGNRVWKSDLARDSQDHPIRDLEPGWFRLRRDGMWRLFDPETGSRIEDSALPAKTRRVLRTKETRYRLTGTPARLEILRRDGRTVLRSIPALGAADRILSVPRAGRLLVASPSEVQLLDTVRGARLCRFPFPVDSGSTKLLVCGDTLVAYDTQTLRAFDVGTGQTRWVLPKLVGGRFRRSVSVGPGGTLVEVVPPEDVTKRRTLGTLYVRAAADARVLWSWSPPAPSHHLDFFREVRVEAIDDEHVLVTVGWGVLD